MSGATPNPIRRRLRAASLLAAVALAAGHVRAQDVEAPAPLPELPAQERADGASFARGLSRSDAAFAVRLGHGRILNLAQDLDAGKPGGEPSIAVGDPGVLDFTVLSPRQIRILGTRLGSTDLSIRTAEGKTITYEVEVLADLDLIRGRLLQAFPDAAIRLSQVGDHLVVEGQARDAAQVSQLIRLVRAAVPTSVATAAGAGPAPAPAPAPAPVPGTPIPPGGVAAQVGPMIVGDASGGADGPPGSLRVLNLLRVPGSQQVLLKVRVAELNRTALRQIGANVLGYDTKSGSLFGTQIGNPVTASGTVSPINLNRSRAFSNATGTNSVSSTTPIQGSGLFGAATSAITSSTTMFGIFQNSNFDVFLNALRRNAILKILAEPNLVALNGHRASFLAGGEFPIPVPQVGATGVASTITVNFKKFGVQLDFLPVILDGDTIRLTVDPEVSSIDFTVGTTLIAGGNPVPGLNTRNAHTTVELKQGQTLAIAGLMQLSLDGQTTRIPGLGDLPVIGPFFSNTTSNRVEKELVVLVTPYLVEPMNCDQVPPLPGDEVGAPNDLEFFFLNRIEGRTGRDFRATTDGADPLRIGRLLKLERKYVRGPVGFSD